MQNYTQMQKLAQLEKLSAMFNEAVKTGFYGEIVVKFEQGRITVCKKTETIKL